MLGGSSPLVTPGGYILGGGHSPITRMKGLGVDQVVAFEIVTANGSIVYMTEEGKGLKATSCLVAWILGKMNTQIVLNIARLYDGES